MGRNDQHTFSKPKNLSVASSRNGPAFCSIFSKGVNSGTISSFFLDTSSLEVCAVEGCREALSATMDVLTRDICQGLFGTWHSTSEVATDVWKHDVSVDGRGHHTVLAFLILLKNPAMVSVYSRNVGRLVTVGITGI